MTPTIDTLPGIIPWTFVLPWPSPDVPVICVTVPALCWWANKPPCRCKTAPGRCAS